MRERLRRFWENQVPLVRSNLAAAALALGGVLLLNLGVWGLVRLLPPERYFAYNNAMTLLRSLLILLLALVGYHAFRVSVNFLLGRSVVTVWGLLLAWLSLAPVGLALWGMPSLVEASIAQAAGRGYGQEYRAFSRLCTAWIAQSREMESPIEVDTAALGLGSSAFQVQATVIINYASSRPAYGFACVLDEDTPADFGRASSYHYEPLRQSMYQFYQKAS